MQKNLNIHIEGLNTHYDHVIEQDGKNPFEVHCEFSVVAMEKPFKTIEQKRKIVENTVFVTYTWDLGSTVIHRPINDNVRYDEDLRKWVVDGLLPADQSDILRNHEAWNLFQKGATDYVIGTPIDAILKNDPSMVLFLRSKRIDTVERLANLSFTEVQALGFGGEDLFKRAKKYLDHANGIAEASKDDERYFAVKEENEVLQTQIAEMQDQLAKLMNAQSLDKKGAKAK